MSSPSPFSAVGSVCDSPPIQPLWSVQPLIWQRLGDLIPILKMPACCCLFHVHWKDTFGPNIKLHVAFSAGREVQLQRGCRLCLHLKGYYIDAALSEQLTNLKHLTATTGQSAVAPLAYSGAFVDGRKASPFFSCASIQRENVQNMCCLCFRYMAIRKLWNQQVVLKWSLHYVWQNFFPLLFKMCCSDIFIGIKNSLNPLITITNSQCPDRK